MNDLIFLNLYFIFPVFFIEKSAMSHSLGKKFTYWLSDDARVGILKDSSFAKISSHG